jgi:hypothetical protein
MKRGQTKTADRAAVQLGRKRGAELVRALAPLLLRRTKRDTLANELKDKFERIVFCNLTPLQVWRQVFMGCCTSKNAALHDRTRSPSHTLPPSHTFPPLCQAELYAACLALPDFENVRLAGELCRCGSGETRGKCCFKAPYVVAGSKGHLDDATVE